MRLVLATQPEAIRCYTCSSGQSQDSLQLDGRSGGGIEDKKRAGMEEASRRGKEWRQDWRTGADRE